MVPKLRFTSFKDKWSSDYLKTLIVSLDAGVSVNSIDELPNENEYSILKTSCVSFGYFDEKERKKVIVEEEISRLKEMLVSNSILISRMNTPSLVGANAYIKDAPKKTFVPDRLWQVKINENICNIRWLSSFLSSGKGRALLREQASGTSNSMKNITKGDVLQIEITYPRKEEQTKIADFLSSVDEKITLLNKQYDLLCQYKKGIMQKIFSQELRFKDENGEEFPEWYEYSLFEMGEVITGKTPSTSVSDNWNGDILFVTPTDMDDSIKYLSSTERKVTLKGAKRVLPKGTIMFTCIASIGKMALSTLPCITNQQINSVIVNEQHDNEFFYYKLQYIRPKVIASQANTTVPIVNKRDFSAICFFIPSLKEQTKIASFLSAIDDKIAAKKTELDKLKIWKQGLLQQMFV
ncbi:restriction endonuclease subunit S [Xenorhabdus nematophila]|uniref:restriction endonuclease subunit S n=1 Tax=Xenorhabdus nematophila TaxID=628 RepID=UPI000E66DD43|nr:restriction endonuclease subunit S [Xenorhabdus nematophila]AYA41664.1 restriction endonuclease subunit S [Xenorhabdus nematophila]QNJ36047.1 restriction endonuclease subunit S [Xenorhabdus nematophila]